MIDLPTLRKSFGTGAPYEIVSGCQAVCPTIEDYAQAEIFIWSIVRRLLSSNRYRAAAHLLWGPDLFDARPKGVSRIIHAIQTNAKVIILGSASSGKSYSIAAFCVLDWLRDPLFTSIRVISTTKGHAKKNTFSSILRFYESAIVPLPGISQTEYVGMDVKDRHAGISMIAIADGQDGKNTLQGFHPVRRPKPDPILGPLSRIRVFADECEMIPATVWKGIGNITSNVHGIETVKIIAACNPWNVTSVTAGLAESAKGWNKTDPDKDFEWMSKMGYAVCRVDAAYSENVIQKKEIFPGLMSYEGYEEKRAKTGGNDAEYWCYGRGFYPLQGTTDQLIPFTLLTNWVGEWIFDSGAVAVAGVDLAFEGDDCIFVAGRYGMATAYRNPGSDIIIKLETPKYCVQIDQYRTLEKVRTEAMYEQIVKTAKEFGVSMQYLALDKSGVGKGVADLFFERGHREVLAIGWGQGSTHTLVLDESRNRCDELYDGIASEMYHALRAYLEFDFIKCSPNFSQDRITKEITGRKHLRSRMGHTGETMYRLEDKKSFRARSGKSPDVADALVMCLHVARTRAPERARMEKTKRVEQTGTFGPDPTNVTYLDFSSE